MSRHSLGIIARMLPVFAVLSVLLLAACGNPSSGTPEVSYTFPTFTTLRDVQEVQDAINAILKPKINATIKLVPIDSGSYDQKRRLAETANQECDIVFTAPWINNYYINVAQGNLAPLDNLLKQYAPKTFASMSAQAWNATRVKGKIYGVLNQQPWTRTVGPRVRKDLADKYGLDLSKINTFEDMTPFLAAVKAGEPNITPIGQASIGDKSIYSSASLGYDIVDGVSSDQGILGVKATDPTLTVVNIASTPEFMDRIELARQWYLAGYYPTEPAGDQLVANWRAGKYALEFDVVNPDSTADLKTKYGADFVAKGLGTPILTTSGIIATMNGICSNSTHKEAAMKVLEELNTDKTVYNLMANGIEGKHYVFTDKAKGVIGFPPGVDASNDGWNPGTPWMFGDLFNGYYRDASIVGAWDQALKINQTATPSQALGFSFDPTNVKTELAQVQAAQQEYGNPLINGRVDPATGIPQYLQKLKGAGIDKVMAELQKQLDAFKASK